MADAPGTAALTEAADRSPPVPAPTTEPTAPRSKLRYPLRSATKPKANDAEATAVAAGGGGPSFTDTAKRVRKPVTVRSSVSVLNVSAAKDKTTSSSSSSAATAASKLPRRYSVPSKLTVSTSPREGEATAAASLTSNASATATPTPMVKKPKHETHKAAAAAAAAAVPTSGKKKFSVLSSVSYWLSQIKVSESVAKHKISLGFFKLALESGCEPVQRMREELKSYALKHNVVQEVGEPAKELLQSYGIVDDLEKLKVSEDSNSNNNNSSPVALENGSNPTKECSSINSANGVAVSTTNIRTVRNLKPRSLNPESPKVREATTKKDVTRPAKTTSAAAAAAKTTRTLQNKNDAVVKPPDAASAIAPDGGDHQKNKTTWLRRSRPDAKTSLIRSSVKKPTAMEKDVPPPMPVAPVSSEEEVPAENKENQENHLEEAMPMEILTA